MRGRTYWLAKQVNSRRSFVSLDVDTWTSSQDEKSKPGSGGEHIRKLIASRGYKMPANAMYVRLVHLLDEAKRRELMIIYGEDLDVG